MSAHVAHFSITGENLTRIARERLLEDPGHAYRILSTALIGDGAEGAVLAILKGEKRLTGDSAAGMGLVKERKSKALTAWMEQVRYIYAGRFRRNGKWMRPAAIVDAYGPDDDHWAYAQRGYVTKNKRARARFYADIGGDVEQLDVPGEGEVCVTFEVCGERPHWEDPPLGAQAALTEFLAAGRTLDRVGYRAPPPEEEGSDDEDEKSDGERLFDSLVRRSLVSYGYVEPTEEEAGEEERRDLAYKAEVQRIRDTVREQAGADTFEMPLSDGRVLTVPRVPFVRWALSRMKNGGELPPWNTVARGSMKAVNDSADHTDWWIGAGLDIDDYKLFDFHSPVSVAAEDKVFEIQEAARNAAEPKPKFAGIFAALEKVRDNRHPAAVIIDKGERTGVVGVDIAVLPDSLESRAAEVASSTGVIVEQGGPLAHIAIVSRANGLTMMRCRNACELFKPGMTVTLSPASGRITIVEKPDA